MLKIAAIAVVVIATSYVALDAIADEPTGPGVFSAVSATARDVIKAPNIDALRTSYAACLKQQVRRYNDGTREAKLVAELTTSACAGRLHDIRWGLLSAGAAENDVAAYANRLQSRAQAKLAEMVEYGF